MYFTFRIHPNTMNSFARFLFNHSYQKIPQTVDLVVIEQACNGENFMIPILLRPQPRGIERMIRLTGAYDPLSQSFSTQRTYGSQRKVIAREANVYSQVFSTAIHIFLHLTNPPM